MKKKLISLLLVGAMAASVALTGCGNSETPADTQQTGGSAVTEQKGDVTAVEEVKLTLTTSYSETEAVGQEIRYFVDYLNEKSGGNVEIQVYWGGTLNDAAEALEFVGTGAADMAVLNAAMFITEMPLLNFPSQVLGGYDAAVDNLNYVLKENETSAPLIEAEATGKNISVLGGVATGYDVFISKTKYETMEEMKSLTLGVGQNQNAYKAVGFKSIVDVMPWDYYDSMSRGIAEVGSMSMSALVSMSLQEVTPYFLAMNSYTAGNFFAMNLDKWNGLSEEAKALFEEAMEATTAYSIEMNTQLDADAESKIQAAGGELNVMPEDEQEEMYKAIFENNVADLRALSAAAGCADEMEAVLKVSAEHLGMELPQ